ncbi:methyltransferase domain-containing protein [Bacteroidia bacterium]|nr:methyltransferase domain-containing protein [Bacteroidia bacterium]
MPTEQKQWFKSWFDTEEYHELYGHRDYAEAEKFISRICEKLKIPSKSHCIDLACGKGRHSNTLAKLGMRVLGLDLSENSISYATENALNGAIFKVHDMRDPLPVENVNYVFNLFTSFGYFEKDSTDLAILKHQFESLKPGGFFVQDYLNAPPIKSSLPLKNLIKKAKNTYRIEKFTENGSIKKQITFLKDGEDQVYTEQVKIYSPEALKSLHEEAGFEVQEVLGEYSLAPFDANISKRIIIISKKC